VLFSSAIADLDGEPANSESGSRVSVERIIVRKVPVGGIELSKSKIRVDVCLRQGIVCIK
jgi:hypothetical protein